MKNDCWVSRSRRCEHGRAQAAGKLDAGKLDAGELAAGKLAVGKLAASERIFMHVGRPDDLHA